MASDLPKLAKLVMLVLLAHADNDSATTQARYTPSLTALAAETGMGRNTVQERLRDLEGAGWIVRQRPPVEQSRKGLRTRYRMVVPVDAAGTQGRSDSDLGVGRTATQLGRTATQGRSDSDPGVGRTAGKPRSHSDPMITQSLDDTHSTQRAGARGSDPSRNGRQPEWLAGTVDFVIERLTATTGRTYDRRDITDSVNNFVSGRKLTDPGAYVRKCADDNPLQFRPTPSPMRYRKEGPPVTTRST